MNIPIPVRMLNTSREIANRSTLLVLHSIIEVMIMAGSQTNAEIQDMHRIGQQAVFRHTWQNAPVTSAGISSLNHSKENSTATSSKNTLTGLAVVLATKYGSRASPE